MSCESLNTQVVRMTVSAGALPEGFCPENMQQFFDAMVSRIIVTPNQSFTSFAAGPIEPTSNVGPWFKDCETFFIWDDSTSRYKPMEKGGFNAMNALDTSGDFTVPAFIYKLRVEIWGGGGGGHNVSGSGGSGGGGGAYASAFLTVIPGQVIPVVIGSGGIAGAPGSDGGDSSVLTVFARGGKGSAVVDRPGNGGTYNGANFGVNGSPGSTGNSFAPGAGGDSGGGGGSGGQWVNNISAGGTSLPDGVVPGGGGAGGMTGLQVSGNGAKGRVLIWY